MGGIVPGRSGRPKHVPAVKFVTILTYAPAVSQIVRVARFIAPTVDPNESARFSDRQQILSDRQ
jgi:hypothetical protein